MQISPRFHSLCIVPQNCSPEYWPRCANQGCGGTQEKAMHRKLFTVVSALAVCAALSAPIRSVAQSQPTAQQQKQGHHHYKLEVMSTFGGPTGNFYDNSNNIAVLNKHGDASGGSADTLIPDPFSPSYWYSNGNVTRAYLWKDDTLIDLGALLSNVNSVSNWLTGNDIVAGYSENGKIDPSVTNLPETSAVIWRNGKIIDLGSLPGGGFQSIANSANSYGEVVGAATNLVQDSNSLYSTDPNFWPISYPYQTRAFIWDEKNGMQDLGTLGTGTDADAQLINERGQIIGTATTSSDPGACFAVTLSSFIWDRKQGMRDLGGFGGTCTLAAAINDSGQVVGNSNVTGDASQRAFLWEEGLFRDLGGSLGGFKTGANAINEKGETVGYAALFGETFTHAALWKKPGQITDLGTVGADPCSFAWAINNKTQVIGESDTTDCVRFDGARPFLWENGSLVDLNDLIPPNSPLQLVYAYTIDDRGEIAGNGWDANGNEHSFRLIPCDDDHVNLEGCEYGLVEDSIATQSKSTAVLRTSAAHASMRIGQLPALRARAIHANHVPQAGSPIK
jgi:probable HAF family extracellular repeat protein